MDEDRSASTKKADQHIAEESRSMAEGIFINTPGPPLRRSNNLPDITYRGYPNMDIKFSGALPVQSSTGKLSINRYYQINDNHPSLFYSEDDSRNTDLVQFGGGGHDTKEQSARIKMALKFSTAAGRIAVFTKTGSGVQFQSSGSGFWIAEKYFITAAHILNPLNSQQIRELHKQSKARDGGMSAWVSTKLQVDEELGKGEYQIFLIDMSNENDMALFKIVDENDLPPYTLAPHDLAPAELSVNTPIFTIAYPADDRDLTDKELTELSTSEPAIAPVIRQIHQSKGRVRTMELLYERHLMTESNPERREWIKQNFREFAKAFPDNTKSFCAGVSMAQTQPLKLNSAVIDMHMSAFYQCSGGMVGYLRKTTKGYVPKVIGIVRGTSSVDPQLNSYTGFTTQGVLALQKQFLG